jgi:hypothetical protein
MDSHPREGKRVLAARRDDPRVTALRLPDGPWVAGEWTIINGTAELEHLRDEAGWRDDLQEVRYSGTIWVMPTESVLVSCN